MPTQPRETRVHGSLLAGAEKRLLIWMAERLPRWVNSDHLTALGAGAMVAAGLGYAVAPFWTPALVLVVVCLAVNWFGDSLDGTLARVRHHERPRYGFYVDHVLDAVGIFFLIAGLFAGGFVSLLPAAAFLIAYYLLNIEIALATHALGVFRISYWKFGPTELRILLAIGAIALFRDPHVDLGELGRLRLFDFGGLIAIAGHRMLLFDIGTTIGAAGLLLTFVVSAINNTRKLYVAEPLPRESRQVSAISCQPSAVRS